MELRRQLSFLRSALPLILVSGFLAGVVAYGVSNLLAPTYESTVGLIVGQTGTGSSSSAVNDLELSEALSQTYATVAESDETARQVIDELQLAGMTPDELLEHVRAVATVDSTILTITVDDPDPVRAANIANSFATALIKSPISGTDPFEALQARVEDELEAVRGLIANVQERITLLEADQTLTDTQIGQLGAYQAQVAQLRQTVATLLPLTVGAPPNQLTVFNPADPADEAVSPRILLNTALGVILGLVLGTAMAYTRRRLDDTVRTPEDLEAVSGLPVLGTIVRMPGDNRRPLFYRLATLLYPRSPAAEGFRHMRTSVEFAGTGEPIRSLLVTSAMPGDGKTTFSSNIAVAFAQAGKSVLLVDSDLRKPAVHDVFRVPNDTGLSDLLSDERLSIESVAQPTDVEGLYVISSGPLPANPAEAVSSVRMRSALTAMMEFADMVVMDSPPLQAVTDAAVLGSFADGTILVTKAGKTRRAAVVRARETLHRVGARVIGAALNGVSEREGEEASVGYFSYYGHAEPPKDDQRKPPSDDGGSMPSSGLPKGRRGPQPVGPPIRAESVGPTDR